MDRERQEERPEPMYCPSSAGQSFTYQLYSWLQPVLFALAVLVLVNTFFGRLIGVDGDSMNPTLHNGDMVVLQSIGYTPKTGDVVVLTPPTFRDGTPIIKRVIATAGQSVSIDYAANTVTVDGVTLAEPYLNPNDPMRQPSFDRYDYPITVPEGSVFVLGDNRNNSSDSRYADIGMVDARCVLGRAFWVLFPLGDFGGILK